MPFWESVLGQYLVQAAFYSLIAIIAVEGMLAAWHIREPLAHIKFRLLALALPVFCPLYSFLFPLRNSFRFREEIALLNLNKWLGLELIWQATPGHLLLAVLAVTAAVFFLKDALPVLRHYLGRYPSLPLIPGGRFPRLDAAVADLSGRMGVPVPEIQLSPEEVPVAHSIGRSGIVFSAPVIDLLDDDELRAVTAHEIAHLSARVRSINRLLLVLRLLLFYNPVSLLLFHRIINDMEKLCDDLAILSTGKRLPLATGLLKIYGSPVPVQKEAGPRIALLESATHSSLVKERLERLVKQEADGPGPYTDARAALTGVMLAVLLFFVV